MLAGRGISLLLDLCLYVAALRKQPHDLAAHRLCTDVSLLKEGLVIIKEVDLAKRNVRYYVKLVMQRNVTI